MNRYAVIFSEPGDKMDAYAQVAAPTPGAAQDECNDAVQDPESIFYLCDYTIWPVPVGERPECQACGCTAHGGACPECGLCN